MGGMNLAVAVTLGLGLVTLVSLIYYGYTSFHYGAEDRAFGFGLVTVLVTCVVGLVLADRPVETQYTGAEASGYRCTWDFNANQDGVAQCVKPRATPPPLTCVYFASRKTVECYVSSTSGAPRNAVVELPEAR
jgi:hypothetical protein